MRAGFGTVMLAVGIVTGLLLAAIAVGGEPWVGTSGNRGADLGLSPAAPVVIDAQKAPTADLRQVYAQIGTMGELAQANAELAADAAVRTMTAGLAATQEAAIATAERELDTRLTRRLEILLTAKPTSSPTPVRRICKPGTPEPGVTCFWPTSTPGPTATVQDCAAMTAADYNEWCEWRGTPVPTPSPTATPIPQATWDAMATALAAVTPNPTVIACLETVDPTHGDAAAVASILACAALMETSVPTPTATPHPWLQPGMGA